MEESGNGTSKTEWLSHLREVEGEGTLRSWGARGKESKCGRVKGQCNGLNYVRPPKGYAEVSSTSESDLIRKQGHWRCNLLRGGHTRMESLTQDACCPHKKTAMGRQRDIKCHMKMEDWSDASISQGRPKIAGRLQLPEAKKRWRRISLLVSEVAQSC